jgi:hypothetical protein
MPVLHEMTPGFKQVPPKLRSSQPAADHDGFFKIVGDIVTLHGEEQAVPSAYPLKYVEEYPKSRESDGFDHAFDVILFRVVSSCPAPTNSAGTAQQGLRRFESRPHPTKARYHLITEGWWEDTIVEFQILSKSNRSANQLAGWFHRGLFQYAYAMKYFQARGVEKFKFVGRLEDDVTKDYSQELQRRRLRYAFRLTFLMTYEAKDLEMLHVGIQQETSAGSASPIESFDLSSD